MYISKYTLCKACASVEVYDGLRVIVFGSVHVLYQTSKHYHLGFPFYQSRER